LRDRLVLLLEWTANGGARHFQPSGSALAEAGSPALAHEFLGPVMGQAVGGKLPADGEQFAVMVNWRQPSRRQDGGSRTRENGHLSG
jgi:hypothetical protein